MTAYPTTPAQFRRAAEAAFRRANPDATDLRVEWTYGPKRVTFPTGLKGFVGQFMATADGYRSGVKHASATRETGLMVR